MDMVVHQAEADDLDGMVRADSAKAESDPVDTGDELERGGEEEIILQAFGGVVIVMRVFHTCPVLGGKIGKNLM